MYRIMSSISKFSFELKEKILTTHIALNTTDCIGKKGKLSLYMETKVHHSRPVNKKKILKEFEIVIPSQKFHMDLDTSHIEAYSYKGETLSIDCMISFTVDDSLFFDSKVEQKILDNILQKPQVSNNAKNILDPKDSFNLIKNLKAISGSDRVQVLGAMIVGACVMLINTYIGWHDQMSPEYATYFYSHVNSDGESSSPLFNSLATSSAAGFAIWVFIRSRLRRYMSFTLQKKQFSDDVNILYKTAEVVSGTTRCDLENALFRVVAGNIEKSQHQETRGSGKKRRTVTVTTQNPVRALILYEQKIDFIPKGANIENYISGEFGFGEMQKVLYPELAVSSTHGLFLHWEMQLILEDYIDQELVCPNNFFQYKNFLKS